MAWTAIRQFVVVAGECLRETACGRLPAGDCLRETACERLPQWTLLVGSLHIVTVSCRFGLLAYYRLVRRFCLQAGVLVDAVMTPEVTPLLASTCWDD